MTARDRSMRLRAFAPRFAWWQLTTKVLNFTFEECPEDASI